MRFVLMSVALTAALSFACSSPTPAGSKARTATTSPAAASAGAASAAGSATSAVPSATDERASSSPIATAPIAAPDLRGALLSASDMPGSWVSGRAQEPQITDSVCNLNIDDPQSGMQQRILLASGPNGLFESLTRYPPDEAVNAVTRVTSAFAACAQWSRVLDNTRLTTYTWTTLDGFPPLGDESAAFNISLIITPGRIQGADHIVVVRRGTLVMLVSFLTPGTGDASQTADLLRRAYDKMSRLPQTP